MGRAEEQTRRRQLANDAAQAILTSRLFCKSTKRAGWLAGWRR